MASPDSTNFLKQLAELREEVDALRDRIDEAQTEERRRLEDRRQIPRPSSDRRVQEFQLDPAGR